MSIYLVTFKKMPLVSLQRIAKVAIFAQKCEVNWVGHLQIVFLCQSKSSSEAIFMKMYFPN